MLYCLENWQVKFWRSSWKHQNSPSQNFQLHIRYVPTVHLVYCFDVDIIIVASVNKLANKAVQSEDYENIHHQQSPTLSAI